MRGRGKESLTVTSLSRRKSTTQRISPDFLGTGNKQKFHGLLLGSITFNRSHSAICFFKLSSYAGLMGRVRHMMGLLVVVSIWCCTKSVVPVSLFSANMSRYLNSKCLRRRVMSGLSPKTSDSCNLSSCNSC